MDISLANRDALLQELGRYRAGLEQLRQMLDAGDGERLAERFGAARARTRWHQQFMRKG